MVSVGCLDLLKQKMKQRWEKENASMILCHTKNSDNITGNQLKLFSLISDDLIWKLFSRLKTVWCIVAVYACCLGAWKDGFVLVHQHRSRT